MDSLRIGARAAGLSAKPLRGARKASAEQLLRDHADVIEADQQGQPVVRGEILALGLNLTNLARLKQAGFRVRDTDNLAGLGLQASVLSVPRGLSAIDAIRQIKSLDPGGEYDFDHIYQASGQIGSFGHAAGPTETTRNQGGLRIGLVDGSVAPSAPSLARARLIQKSFALGGARATAHATAVASLMVGDDRSFRGADPGASLYVADVYGTQFTGGSALNVAQGLAWLAQNRIPVINVSLVGPPNTILEAAIRTLIARGHIVVAAVGNDGPAAAPLYPASYSGVIAVTAVDAHRRALREAGRGAHVDFAAPGADMVAASLNDGFVRVRGTSFAAPIVAGKLARLLPTPDPAGAIHAVEMLAREATDLGVRGPDPTYGRGFVSLDPGAVGGMDHYPKPRR